MAGLYTIELDLGTMTATISPKVDRGAQANDDLYLLPITRFLRNNSLSVTAVRRNGATIDLTYEVTHPFAGPSDPAGTPTATNRADLGIAGMVLFLVDVPTAGGNTYFDEGAQGQVVANTTLVTNPDAYFRPRAMVPTPGLANTFPYKLLVDETASLHGSRVGISNGGQATGNFGADGWTRDELGGTAPFNKWTGFGVLHQGQAATNTLSLDAGFFAGGSRYTFEAAIIAKYNDPRGGATAQEKRANRLPPPTPDHTRFAYRMPHGALDVQRIVFRGTTGTGFRTNEASSAILQFHLEDWDARAPETMLGDLAAEPDVTLVAEGESGLPGFAVSIPGVIGGPGVVDVWDPASAVMDDDTAVGGDPSLDSGRPGDALFYAREVIKAAGSGETAGTYTGMARAIDPEPGGLVLKLDENLNPLTADAPTQEVYQVFRVEMEGPVEPDRGWAKLLDPGVDKWAEATGVAIDSEGNVLAVGFFHQTIDLGGGERTTHGGMDNFVVKYDRTGRYLWDFAWGSTSDENYRMVSTDPVTLDVYVGGSFDGATDFDGSGPLPSMPNHGREDGFVMKFSPAGALQWLRVFGDLAAAPEAEVTKNMTADATGVYLGGFHRSGGLKFHPDDPGFLNSTIAAAFIVKFLPNGDFGWAKGYDGGFHDETRGVAGAGGTGLIAVIDYYSDVIDVGGGPRPNTDPSGKTDDMVLVRLDAATGAYVTDVHPTGSSIEQPQALAANAQYVAVTGHTWSTDLNFGNGPLPHMGQSDFYWARFDAVTLEHQWSGMLGSENYDPGFGVAVDPTGAVYVGGLFQGPIDFGFGPVTPNNQDGFLYKLAPDGSPAWVHTWGGPVEFVRGTSVATDGNAVAIVGVHGVGGPIDYEPGPPVTELTSVGISGSLQRILSGGTW